MSGTEHNLDKARRLHKAGQLNDARRIYDEVLRNEPGNHRALHLRGMLALQEGALGEAEQLVRQALSRAPGRAEYLSALGQVLYFGGDADGAGTAWRDALAADPNDATTAYNYGTLALERQQLPLAEKWLRAAIGNGEQENWQARANLAHALSRQRRHHDAAAEYGAALQISPDNAELLTSYADTLNHMGAPNDAKALLDRAIRGQPDFAPAFLNLANACLALADVPGAMDALSQAIEIDPGLEDAHHKRLFFSHYLEDSSAPELFESHAAWGDAFTRRNAGGQTVPKTAPQGGGQLRIGYVSSDFGWHSVGLFIHSVIEAHDKARFHVTCYSGLESEDEMTRVIKKYADAWRETSALSDDQMAAMICEDRIDILIDLAGHTGGNRLGVFARRPAPLQISYLGYPGTTGLASIGYRVADAWTEPEGAADALSVEKILRLAGGFHCFAGPWSEPPVQPPPVLTKGMISFGSFNNIAKINDGVVALWAEILNRVPESRLILKDQRFKLADTRRRMTRVFAARGIAADRLNLMGAQAERRDHLALYAEVDIALDPFPYNGTTTTCEALWMGVPVVTLVGARPDARVGLSLLSQMELSDLIANTPDEYIAKSAELAIDMEKLANFRNELRNRLESSSIGKINAFTQKLEAAYLQAWQETMAGLSDPMEDG
jgi:predicted O-linked N-acetylglucosamine transferase (SPINDLY family)